MSDLPIDTEPDKGRNSKRVGSLFIIYLYIYIFIYIKTIILTLPVLHVHSFCFNYGIVFSGEIENEQ